MSCWLQLQHESRSKDIAFSHRHTAPAGFREAGTFPEIILRSLFLVYFPPPIQPAFPASISRLLSNLSGLGGSWGDEKQVDWETSVARSISVPHGGDRMSGGRPGFEAIRGGSEHGPEPQDHQP